MTRSTHLCAAAAVLVSACDPAQGAADPCATTQAITPHGVAIDAELAGPDDADAEPVDCATYTIEQDNGWSMHGATPSSIDVAPGAYSVQVDWTDGQVAYTSDPVIVRVGDDIADVTVALCPDLEGAWTCDGGQSRVQATMDGCTVSIDALGLSGHIDGHTIDNGKEMSAQIRAGAARIDGVAGGEELICFRQD